MTWRTPKYIVAIIMIVVSFFIFYYSNQLKENVTQLRDEITEPLKVLPKLINGTQTDTSGMTFINNTDEYLKTNLQRTYSVTYDAIKYEGTLISGIGVLLAGLGLLIIPVDEYERELWSNVIKFFNPF